ncbi:acidic mammalian chitinase-like, partial [Brachionus plicatilis]
MNLGFKILAFSAIFSSFIQIIVGKKIISCYHTNWSQYREGLGRFYPENIDPFLCDIIIYAFAKLEGDRLDPFEFNDLSTDTKVGMYEQTLDLKKKNPNLKILIATGGWNVGSGPFSVMANNFEMRKNFVKNAREFVQLHGFDGLDLDWEYPGSREGSAVTDKEVFSLLISELKAEFEPYDLMLTAAVGVSEKIVEAGYEVEKICRDLDFVNLMSY